MKKHAKNTLQSLAVTIAAFFLVAGMGVGGTAAAFAQPAQGGIAAGKCC
ncbi:MAG TPA: hypothetical protein VKQ34_01835 [Candidatus Saccharimonadales bacterium]|nr:hypothetical protein [Candidatus Saccharimonadales bacterium]